MPRVKVAAKRPRSDRPPSSSSSEEEDPHTKRIDRCPILIGKNVDLASFTFDAPSFNLENLFEVVNDLHNTATTIQATVDGIQATVGGLQSSVDGITSMLHALNSYLSTGFPPPEI
ncbi:hypothetical protein Adt_42084 [Abeliophyllum distichum]|uniref:Uncharacterized protein n=1 Tax=Abeliophyllum distichum TaxID=126358 RepID=A0ABD1PQP2_9LAMI